MPRQFACQVHLATSRLLKAGVLQQPPVWYNAVVSYPPIPLPPRDAPCRPVFWLPEEDNKTQGHKIPFDLPVKAFTPKAQEKARQAIKTPPPRIQSIEYTEDRIRSQFFRDHPFEALRPRTLIEQGSLRTEHLVQGLEWTRLSQHGRAPHLRTIKFATCLHDYHKKSITEAYQTAVSQFRALRAEHHMATLFARNEAVFYGARFRPDQSTRAYILENKALGTWTRTSDASANAGRQRRTLKGKYFPVWMGRMGVTDYWSRGVGYTRRWMKGMPPPYWPTKGERRVKAQQKAADAAQTLLHEKEEEKGRNLIHNPW
ncbi:uncharacterized protein EI90DRAFT_3280971 [Cantharellus anzutake]|uniref:uncharacterized protein n=1 Tax=Cantharellus anzutake TaxID=1750568 RepID=UPI001903BD14|nr:uncharacterized protein EI90DRAFT_3280971 [Cantharellus anzutake]KAF8330429.1 hypothetical protein EI90DRAFT_3280971 [Cantharellus anzutake]